MIDYLKIAQEYHGRRSDGFFTNVPMPVELNSDDIIEVRHDVQTMRWIANRSSKITYPKARELIKQYRREYAEKWG